MRVADVKDPVSVELPRQLIEGEFQLDQLEIEGIPSPPSIERCQAEAGAKRGEETGEQPLAPAAAAARRAAPVRAVLQTMSLTGPIGRGVNQPMLSCAAENVVVERVFVQQAGTLSGDALICRRPLATGAYGPGPGLHEGRNVASRRCAAVQAISRRCNGQERTLGQASLWCNRSVSSIPRSALCCRH